MKYAMKLLSLVVFIILTTVGSASAATYYTAKSGNDSNSCSLAQSTSTAKMTIRGGISCLRAGDTLSIRGGVYDERISNLDYPIPSGTSWNNAVTIAEYSGESAIVRPSNSGVAVLYLLYKTVPYQYIVFDGITFDANLVNTFAVSLDGYNYALNVHHIRFRNTEFTNSKLSGVLTGRGANLLEFLNVKAYRCGNDTQYDHGLYLQSSDSLVDGGEFSNNASAGIQIYTGLNGGADSANRNIVRNARIHHNRFGLILGSGDRNISINNLVYSNTLEGIKTGFNHGVNTGIYNNTIYANGGNGVEVRSGISGVSVTNNIVYGNGVSIYDIGSGTVKLSNLTTDPWFVNAAAGDFHLKQGSVAINRGTSIDMVLVDYDGDLRPLGGAYDIGADEYLVLPTGLPSAPIGLVTTPQ